MKMKKKTTKEKTPTLPSLWRKLCDIALEVNNVEAVGRNRMNNLEAKLASLGSGAALADAHSVFVQPEKPFCVIANTARYIAGGAQGRSWYATQKQAEGHAESIMRNHPNQYEELYVVEIKSKVAKQRPELEVTRY